MEDKWYILAGTVVWSVVLILIALILIRLLKQYRMEQRMEQMEEAEARRVANRFAAPDSSQNSSSDTVTTLDLDLPENDQGQARWRFFGANRQRPPPVPRPPNRFNVAHESFSVWHGLTPDELHTYCPVVIHEQPKDGQKDMSTEGQLSEDGQLVCAVCLDEVAYGQRKRVLPCSHAFHARCVQIWLQKANKCPCCMTAVARRIMFPDLPEIGIEQLMGLPMSNGHFLPLEQRRRAPRPRFLGLWTFGNRRWNPEVIERLRQAAIQENQRADANRALASARRLSASEVISRTQEIAEQLERVYQIDNMADRSA